MKLGDVVGGYRITTRPGNANAGKCVWAFAEKDGAEFFVKEFLDPKLPRPDAMGTVADKERRFAECRAFERRHREIMRRLPADHEHAGNLVLAVDFFPQGTRYYKVTARLRPADDVVPHQLSPQGQAVLLGTLLDSLRLLHSRGIVHGDLKPENIVLHRPPLSDLCTAKLIDFDDAYVSGAPPDPAVIGGNPRFGAPEWVRYQRSEVASLTTAADMFALALIVHEYLTGSPPSFPGGFATAGEAVASGARLALAPTLRPEVAALLTRLTDPDPPRRPTAGEAAPVLENPAVLSIQDIRRSRLRINI